LEHPHDVRFSNSISSAYTVPGAYFSPLTSPALDGQTFPYNANSGASTGSLDLDANHEGPQSRAKSRKRPNTTRSTSTRSKISPALAARKKVQPIEETQMETLNERIQSISPDLGGSMGPPLHPASANQSPALTGIPGGAAPIGHATPSSLMRMRSSPREQKRSSTQLARVPLPPLTLPESAVAEWNTDDANFDADMESPSRKTPKYGAMSTPSDLRRPGSTSALGSPISGDHSKRIEKARSKKRTSVSNSVLVSPALRPKISPSIKPLLPEGGKFSSFYSVLTS
jgi:hypothetical protein